MAYATTDETGRVLGVLASLVSAASGHQPCSRPAPTTRSNAGPAWVSGDSRRQRGLNQVAGRNRAREIGWVRARMLLDASEEIEKYHWGPLQIALCLLAGVLAKYEALCRDDRSFQDDGIDAYLGQHAGFVNGLRDLRHSLLHQRYDSMPTQVEFIGKFAGGQISAPNNSRRSGARPIRRLPRGRSRAGRGRAGSGR